jgi:hypothetical protein
VTAASAKATHFHRDGVEARNRLDAVAVFCRIEKRPSRSYVYGYGRVATETPMRAFIIALVAVAVLATTWSFTLNIFQQTAAQAMTTGSARLDQQEAVNLLGREG